MTFEQHLAELALYPDDRGRHAVFADWLLERGDVRGEALALELDGSHARLAALRKKHEREWLGSAFEHVDVARCTFYGGFPSKLSFKRGAPIEHVPLSVRHLAGDWRKLPALAGRTFEVLEVLIGLGLAYSDFRALAEELDAVAAVKTKHLQLVIDAFAGVEAARFVAAGFLRSGLAEQERVTLIVRDGSLDAACAWLYEAAAWGGGDRWGTQWGGALLTLERDRRDHFTHVDIDLSFEDEKAIAARAASAATMLSQLRRLGPTRIEAHFPEGQRVARRLRQTLEAPLKFLPGIRGVRIGRTSKK